jgi:hypothetical protein
VHRVLSLVKKNYDGIIPSPSYPDTATGAADKEKDGALLGMAESTLVAARVIMESDNDLHKIINLIMKIPREGMCLEGSLLTKKHHYSLTS